MDTCLPYDTLSQRLDGLDEKANVRQYYGSVHFEVPTELDPFPTSLLKDCLDIIIEPITSISNKSLQEVFFRTSSKKTFIRPLPGEMKFIKS